MGSDAGLDFGELTMSTGHDTKCPNCKGAGERMERTITRKPIPPELGEIVGMIEISEFARIVECNLCIGTGLVELDESWEHG